MENHGGLGPPLVDHGRRWSTVNPGHGRPTSSLELGPAAAPGHGGSPAMAQQRERSMGSLSGASPWRGQWCRNRVMTVKRWRWWCSSAERGEGGRGRGEGATASR
jgi:hypothetical protein